MVLQGFIWPYNALMGSKGEGLSTVKTLRMGSCPLRTKEEVGGGLYVICKHVTILPLPIMIAQVGGCILIGANLAGREW